MPFWQTVAASVTSGAVLAVVATLLAIYVTGRNRKKNNLATAKRERDLAAAADLYRVHGQFYAAWKAWNFYFDRGGTRESKECQTTDCAAKRRPRRLTPRVVTSRSFSVSHSSMISTTNKRPPCGVSGSHSRNYGTRSGTTSRCSGGATQKRSPDIATTNASNRSYLSWLKS